MNKILCVFILIGVACWIPMMIELTNIIRTKHKNTKYDRMNEFEQ